MPCRGMQDERDNRRIWNGHFIYSGWGDDSFVPWSRINGVFCILKKQKVLVKENRGVENE